MIILFKLITLFLQTKFFFSSWWGRFLPISIVLSKNGILIKKKEKKQTWSFFLFVFCCWVGQLGGDDKKEGKIYIFLNFKNYAKVELSQNFMQKIMGKNDSNKYCSSPFDAMKFRGAIWSQFVLCNNRPFFVDQLFTSHLNSSSTKHSLLLLQSYKFPK